MRCISCHFEEISWAVVGIVVLGLFLFVLGFLIVEFSVGKVGGSFIVVVVVCFAFPIALAIESLEVAEV